MSKINHLSLDTTKLTVSSREDFSDSDLDEMTQWLANALKAQGVVSLPYPLEDYSALADEGEEGLVCTVYAPSDVIPVGILRGFDEEVLEEGVPILIFGVALDNGKSLWELFIQGFYIGEEPVDMPVAPWVTVIPYEMYPHIPDAVQLEKFEKCVARAWFESKKILH